MHEPSPIPYSRPTPVTAVTIEPIPQNVTLAPPPVAGGANLAAAPRTDRLAIASAVCGLTAFVPVVSQLVGLVLGVISLLRIRRARRAGVAVGGTSWAAAGIASSVFALLLWLGIMAAYAAVGSSLSHATNAFQPLLHGAPTQHVWVRNR